jgi:membrane-anchored protein YejM (alkaline phosphatase superfamily)
MRLAQHGISFRNHATVFCESVRANYGIHYSDYLTDIGTTPRMLYGNSAPMPSLAEAIKSEGYQTAVFSSAFMKYNDLLYLFQNKGVDTIVQADQLWKGESLPWSWGVREEKGIEALCSWIGDHRSHPFFATYLTTFPHHPYICPIDDQPFTGNGWRDRYRNSLHYADMCLGKLLDRLSALHLLDTTIIAVVGDHGETVSSYPVGHGLALTREEVFTPFIVSNPRLFPEPQESELSTSHLDIAPTLASLVGAKIPADWLGRNLMTEQIPARLSFIQAKLAHVHGIVDNGIIYVFEAARNRSHLFDFHTGGFSPLDATDPRQSITSLYRDADETFQKWAVWRHMARASGEVDHLVAAESRQPTTMPTRHASLLP